MGLSSFLLLSLALAYEAAVGYPKALFRAVGHPVTWMGSLIACLDRGLNRDEDPPQARRTKGVLALIVLIAIAGGTAWVLQATMDVLPFGILLVALLAASLLAQRSLREHVEAVAAGLEKEGLAGGRRAVSMIVGRNPETLDEAGVCRAAIESLAENFSDGVVAPAFWLGVAGLPGIVLYKAINTADSMIGHKTERHRAFGWASARLDDLVNLPASRLTALLVVAAAIVTPGADAAAAWRAVRRDARHHRSPNAGWPEAAMAGALGLRLAGPRVYGSTLVEDFWMGDGRAEATVDDIRRALQLNRMAYVMMFGLAAMLPGLLFV
ncbi:adenosylcobinamide-phosphate synthase CbiB [Chelatococcus sp. SYSU_G07232]|uniref:Cobalamin biosynthesis protein CobD n=1 Tax=Chelatococcus albus TaxID=3047466 RepID=A0ABT7AJA4_9HYPH|nr:adenosylcobinamide-phosphate synthase CbiB [Chelatococcus sp. SYSU_G07232]MDJ1159465.1 adenosylcobinamide-phosphate synthase CbiB [Chelatococcus sp. SYSU_G07232]